MKVALVHDWLIHMRGGEKVLEGLYEVFPDAEIFTLFYRREKLSPVLKKAKIHGSFFQLLPGVAGYYRWLLGLMPLAITTLRPKGFDVVLSINHCVAKACPIPKGALHICYCLTPVRYVWGYREDYFGSYPAPLRQAIHWFLDRFKKWDLKTNDNVRIFIADCENVRSRITGTYGRDAQIVYPPVETSHFSLQESHEMRDYFLVVSALVPYKRVDLAVEAFNRLGLPLWIVGEGPEGTRLRRLARANVRFLGSVDAEVLKNYYAGCRALIFPGEEDFGIVPLEAQSCGRPVIAYGKGGALETVSSESGLFFNEQTPEALMEAVRQFEHLRFHPARIREGALRFDREIFKKRMRELVLNLYEAWRNEKSIDNVFSAAQK